MIVTYARLAAGLRDLPPSCGRVRVVAVDGRSGAGKSTFARRLARALGGAPVVGADDFPVPWDADPLAWREPLAASVLAPLAAGRPGRLARYDWRHGTYGAPEPIPPSPVLIVEGVGAADAATLPEPPATVSYVVWAEAPPDVRRARVLGRDGPEVAGPWRAWTEREGRYFATVRTRDRADMIVDGAPRIAHDPGREFVRVT